MRNRRRRLDRLSRNVSEDALPVPWQRIQGAIWLTGLAILAWQGWFWPGILVLMAISGLFQAGVQFYLSKQEEQKVQTAEIDRLAEERARLLPSVCPNCGGPLNAEKVRWTGPRSASCPYCSVNLKPQE